MGGKGSGNPRGFRAPMPPGWVPIGEAARALGVSRRSLWQGIRSGEVTAYREFVVGKRIFYGFRVEDLGI